MKITRILSASVLAGAVLLSGTACSMLDGKKDEKISSSSTAPAESQAVETEEAVEAVDEQQAVANTVNGFYAYVSVPENAEAIKQAGEPLQGRGATASDEELNQLAESLPEGFYYFDTSSPDLIKNAYVQLLMGAGVMSSGKMEANVPADVVVVDGDTATIDSTAIEVMMDGEKIDVPSNADAQALKLKKDESGSWVMVADAISGITKK